MAIEEILVHATQGSDCVPRLEAAAAIAARSNAHLTALYTMWIPPMPVYVEAQLGQDLLDRQRQLYEGVVEGVQSKFEEIVARTGVSAEWRVSEVPRVKALTLNGRYSDLLIMGRHTEDFPEPEVNLVEAVVLDSPKPVLVLPDDGAPQGVGTHAMIAWNASREAVRAVDAALPLLKQAERVDVIAVNPRTGPDEAHGDVPGMDLCAHLARHGVRAQADALSTDNHPVGATLLGRAVADGCNLLVMGAYGHARWREVILGGATAHILRHAKMPLLLAH